MKNKNKKYSILAGDHLADGSMKNVASYVNRCELRSMEHLIFERTLRLSTSLSHVCVRVV